MRFDDPEPTQLLNGYAPHLNRKCVLNCQKDFSARMHERIVVTLTNVYSEK